jgi:hypothetical protein
MRFAPPTGFFAQYQLLVLRFRSRFGQLPYYVLLLPVVST